MESLLTALFSFLSTPCGQAVINEGGQVTIRAVKELVHLTHKRATPPPLPEKP